MKRAYLAAFAVLLALPNHRCLPIEEAEAQPAAYGAGIRRVYDEGTYVTSSAGALNCVGDGIACTVSGGTVIATVAGGGGGGGYATIEEEGSGLPQETTLNFVGAALTAADDTGQTNVTLSQSPASASVVGTGRTLTAGTCIAALGDLSADRTVNVDVGCSPTWSGTHTFSNAPTLSAGAQSALGAAGTPAYTFTGDTDTGMYASAANVLNFATTGTSRLSIASAGVISQVVVQSAAGSASAPGFSFNADTNTGVFRAAADTLAFATSGAEVARIDATGNFGIGVTPTARMSLKNHAAFAGSERNSTTAAVQTTDATQTTVFSLTLSDTTLYFFEASCAGRGTAGAERAYYRRATRVHREGGGATLGTVDTGFSDETTAGMDLTFTVSSNDLRLSVTGIAATTINWACSVVYQAVSGSS